MATLAPLQSRLGPSAWIASPMLDSVFILFPALGVTALVLLLPNVFATGREVPTWAWGVLILGVDVAHVYSTVFRTYLNPQMWQTRRQLLVGVPIGCLLGGVALYAIGDMVFWRVLAYLAVFHFVRQQYGFMRIYARHEIPLTRYDALLDHSVITLATLYPLVYWHTHLPRHFTWFLPGDFVPGLPPVIESVVWSLGLLAGGVYLFKEVTLWLRDGRLNLPKNLLLLGTALSWTVGIVVCNGDLAFTATNVISHGIPYMALVWWTTRHPGPLFSTDSKPPVLFSPPWGTVSSVLGFLACLGVLAFVEEGLWDGLVWREHGGVFAWFQGLPALVHPMALMLAVPLLSVPQATHYLLDGFIWRLPPGDTMPGVARSA